MRLKMAPGWLVAGLLVACTTPVLAQTAEQRFQGRTLFGEPMYTTGPNPVNVGATSDLLRASAEAKAAFEADPSVDNATWYGRLLGYQGLMKEAIDVFTAGLKRHPDSAKLLRHRAHRYFSLREFDKSIADGLRAAALYQGQPLEREKLGPSYFPSTPDVVQFYLYYHLGSAYFAKGDYDKAAQWFARSREVAEGVGGVSDRTASTYWEYLSLARGGRYGDGRRLLDDYDLTLADLGPGNESSNYFDGIQLFRQLRSPTDFFSDKDSGRAFGTSDGMKASTSYSLANHFLLQGEREKAKQHLRNAMSVGTWSYFARIQAEADWVRIFGPERP